MYGPLRRWAESRKEDREDGRRGVVGRERVREFLRVAEVERLRWEDEARGAVGVVDAMMGKRCVSLLMVYKSRGR